MTGRENRLSQIATTLSRHNTIVRLRPPVDINAMGEMYRIDDATAGIDIHPDVGTEFSRFCTFMHEVAHVYLDFDHIPVSDRVSKPSASEDKFVAMKGNSRSSDDGEVRADVQAFHWISNLVGIWEMWKYSKEFGDEEQG